MNVRRALVVTTALALLLAVVTPAAAAPLISPDTGKNIHAWPKGQSTWSAHLNCPDRSLQGEAHFAETACHDGVGMTITAPGLGEPTGGVLTAVTDTGTYEIPITDYQVMVGFVFVLDHWPNPWPVDPVYLDPTTPSMPLFVEWDQQFGPGTLTTEAFFGALSAGRVSVQIADVDGVVMSGTVR